MVTYYLDTSAAVKLYLVEIGSDWLRQLLVTDPMPGIFSSYLLRVELWSAFARRRREDNVTVQEYSQLQSWFAEHQQSLYRLVPLNETIIQQACQLIERHPLRSYDAVHLATALILNQRLAESGVNLVFLSADNRLTQAGLAEGLAVDNPNNYPDSSG